jgi:two-component system chemotaxis response regulator CheY
MRFLIVEDDLTSRRLLEKILEPYGQYESVENGKEAVAAFNRALDERRPFHLVCMDIMMPEMDGQAALKAIRQLEKEKGVLPKDEVPVIMTTALDTPKEVVEAFYRGGCTEYMVKPIEKRKIIDFLREHGLMT